MSGSFQDGVRFIKHQLSIYDSLIDSWVISIHRSLVRTYIAYSFFCACITPLPKKSLTVPKRSLLRCSSDMKSSCWSADSTCRRRIALIVEFWGAQTGHSASSPVLLRQRWWKECLQRKWTVGKSRALSHVRHLRAWKTAGFEASCSSSLFLASVSVV